LISKAGAYLLQQAQDTTQPRWARPRGRQIGGSTDLLVGNALAADRHIGLAQDRRDADFEML
jgi:hypothetical protein